MTSQEVRLELDRVFEFWVARRSELLAMPRRFTSVKSGLRLTMEPEELINEALCRCAKHVECAPTPDELRDRSAKVCDLRYVYRVLEHLNTDEARRHGKESSTDPEDLVLFLDQPEEDTSEKQVSTMDRERLRVIIGVLRARAEGTSPRLTSLTSIHIACWRAMLQERGAQAALAEQLGVHPSRVSQVKRSARAKLCETVYVAGVLGPKDGLDDVQLLAQCLDVYDSAALSHAHMTPADRVCLSIAAEAVTITEKRGQRVDPRRAAERFLRRKDKKTLRDQIAADGESAFEEFMGAFTRKLHHAEALQAWGAGVRHPNCVAVCEDHNPERADRLIWEMEMCHG